MGERITGERASSGAAGFNPAFQRHAFVYREVGKRLPDGRILDLGCGTGHSYELLGPRESVGVDISAEALAGQPRETVVADMADVPLPDSSFGSVLSSHSIEHVPQPDRVVSEAARLVEDDGLVVFVTPNRLTFGRPDEIIDPFHIIEFSPAELRALCEADFSEVEIMGLYGSPRYMEHFDQERRTLDRLLRLDPLKLRRLIPNRVKRWLYDFFLNRFRRDEDPAAAAIDQTDFEIRGGDIDDCLDVFAFCRGPKTGAK